MKKTFRLLSLLIAVATLFSAMGAVTFASTEASTLRELALNTFDNTELKAGDVYRATGATSNYPSNTAPYIQMGGWSTKLVLEDKGNGDLYAKVVNDAASANATFVALPDANFIKTEELLNIRSGNLAYVFDFKTTDNEYFRVLASGTGVDGTTVNSATLVEIKGQTAVTSYSYPERKTSPYKGENNNTIFTKNEFHRFKFIFKKAVTDEAGTVTGGTFDFYLDDVLVREDAILAFPSKLFKLFAQVQQKDYGAGLEFGKSFAAFDNVGLYSLSDADVTAQVKINEVKNGTVKLEKAITGVGDTQNIVITPDEGYEIKKITFNGEEVKGYNRAGFTYVTPALTSEGGAVTVEFGEKREFGKAFELNFDDYEKDKVLIDTLNDGIDKNQKNINFSTGSANIYALDAVVSAHEEAAGKNSLKVYSTVESSATMYTFINKDMYAEVCKEDFAIAFRTNVSEGNSFRYTLRNHNESGSRTVIETANGIFKVHGQVYNETSGKREYKTYNTNLNVVDGKYHDYKLIFSPSGEKMDVYVDNVCVVKDVEMPDSDQLYYNALQIRGAKGVVMTAFIDNYECYALTSADVNAQLNVNCGDGKFETDKTVTSEGEKVSFTVTPVRGKLVSEVKFNGQALTAVNGVYETPALTSTENDIEVIYSKIRVLSERFAVDFDNYTENQIIVDSYNDGVYNKQLSANLYKEGTAVTSNIWTNDSIISAHKEAEGDMAMKVEMKKPVENVNAVGGFTFYSFMENTDKTLYKETTSDTFAITFRLKMQESQTGRITVKDVNFAGNTSRTIMTIRANDLVFYDYYMENEKLSYKGKTVGGVHDNEYHDYKFVFNPKANTYDVYIDNILVAEKLRNPDVNQYYYVAFQIYGSAEKDLTLFLNEYTCYEMANGDVDAQIKGKVSGNGKIITDKLITEAGEKVALQVVSDEGSFIKNLSLNGINVPAFDTTGDYSVTVDAGTAVSAEFYGYTENAPAIVTTGYAVKDENKIYLFNKLIANGTEVSEFGMLFSKTNKNPVVGGADVSVITYEKEIGNYGYHGYMLYNGTGNDDLSFYVRPYAKVGETVYYGDIKAVNASALESVK